MPYFPGKRSTVSQPSRFSEQACLELLFPVLVSLVFHLILQFPAGGIFTLQNNSDVACYQMQDEDMVEDRDGTDASDVEISGDQGYLHARGSEAPMSDKVGIKQHNEIIQRGWGSR